MSDPSPLRRRRTPGKANQMPHSPGPLLLLRLHLRRRLSSLAYSPPPLKPSSSLTEAELSQIHSLLHCLCDAGRLPDAVRLIGAALLVDPPLSSLPLPFLAERLASHTDFAPAMSLLTTLHHHPRRPSPLPFASLLLCSFLRRRRPKEAAKVFSWLCRADSTCRPDREIYLIAIEGFCSLGKPLEGLKAMREMVRDGVTAGKEMREAVWRGLLQEARVREAQELDSVWCRVEDGVDELDRVGEVLDRIIGDWQD